MGLDCYFRVSQGSGLHSEAFRFLLRLRQLNAYEPTWLSN
jgi:hypothetical protein